MTEGSTSHTLLHIKARLASFRINPPFINATDTFADPMSGSTQPSAVAFRVNTLWFVSLTLSIIAAFFAIAVQQWLRHILVPKHIPLRDAIRLRQLRYKGLMRWQVPVIITALPALVQISVVLFLVGLFEYVRLSSDRVALPFTVISSLSLVLFVIVSFIPLIDPSCPYKSPLVHIAWELSWFAGIIAALAVVFPIVAILDCATPRKHAKASSLANGIYSLYKRYAGKLKPSTTEASSFWTARESAHASKDVQALDRMALSWALTAGPPVSKLACCLQDLALRERTRCVLEWISVKFYGEADASRLLDPTGTVSKETFDRIQEVKPSEFAKEFARVLLAVLSEGWKSEQERAADEDIPHILMILWHLADIGVEVPLNAQDEAPTRLRVPVIDNVKELCLAWEKADLEAAQSWQGWKPTFRISSVLLFDLITKDDAYRTSYLLGKGVYLHVSFGAPTHSLTDPVNYLKKATDLVTGVTDLQQGDSATKSWIAPMEHISSLTAVALRAVVDNRSRLDAMDVRTALRELMTALTALLKKAEYQKKEKKQFRPENRIRKIVRKKLEELERDSTTLPFVTINALNSICRSLEQLGTEKKGRTDDWMIAARSFAEHLLPLCEDESKVRVGKEALQSFLNSSASEKSGVPGPGHQQRMMSMSEMSGVDVIGTIAPVSPPSSHHDR